MSCKGAGGNSPATLAEFTLAGDQGKDFYDVSLVDGFNLPMSVVPQGAGCSTTSCAADVNAGCPAALAVIESPNPNPNTNTIGCKSACVALKEPQYCCTGAYGTPQTCKPTVYSNYFKSKCPQAYSYAYDDPTSTFTCPTGGNYLITFCPWMYFWFGYVSSLKQARVVMYVQSIIALPNCLIWGCHSWFDYMYPFYVRRSYNE